MIYSSKNKYKNYQERCLLIQIPYSVVSGTTNSPENSRINTITVIENCSNTYPFEVQNINNISTLFYWNGNEFQEFVSPSQYSNVQLEILSSSLNKEYVVKICPQNKNHTMILGDQIIEPYYQYYDIVNITKDSKAMITTIPDLFFEIEDYDNYLNLNTYVPKDPSSVENQ
jgi:hypothetical protein